MIVRQYIYHRRSGLGEPKYGQFKRVLLPSVVLMSSSLGPNRRGFISADNIVKLELLVKVDGAFKFEYLASSSSYPLQPRKHLP